MPFHSKVSSLFIKALSILITPIILLGFFTSSPADAAFGTKCDVFTTNPPVDTWTTSTNPDSISITIGGGLADGQKYYLYLLTAKDPKNPKYLNSDDETASGGTITVTPWKETRKHLVEEGTHTLTLNTKKDSRASNTFCSVTYTVKIFEGLKCEIKVNKTTSYGPGEKVEIKGKFWWLDVNNQTRPYKNEEIDARLWYKQTTTVRQRVDLKTDDNGNFSDNRITIPAVNTADIGWWEISVSKNNPNDSEKKLCTVPIYVSQTSGEQPPGPPPPPGPTSGQNPCQPGTSGKVECETALGPIPTDPTAFAGKVLGIATGLAGGLALILMVIGSIRVLTSSGDQQKLSAGRDMIVGAVAGLLFLIFSVLILRFIGVEILNIQFFR